MGTILDNLSNNHPSRRQGLCCQQIPDLYLALSGKSLIWINVCYMEIDKARVNVGWADGSLKENQLQCRARLNEHLHGSALW